MGDYWPLAEYEDRDIVVSLYVIHFLRISYSSSAGQTADFTLSDECTNISNVDVGEVLPVHTSCDLCLKRSIKKVLKSWLSNQTWKHFSSP